MSNTCADIESAQITYLDGELEHIEQREFENHLADCSSCQERLNTILASHCALRAHLQDTPPPPDQFRKRLVSALDQDDARQRQHERQQRIFWFLPATASALAAVALTAFVWSNWSATKNQQPVAQSSQLIGDTTHPPSQSPPLFAVSGGSSASVGGSSASVGGSSASVGGSSASVGEMAYPYHPPGAEYIERTLRVVGRFAAERDDQQNLSLVYKIANHFGEDHHHTCIHKIRIQTLDAKTLDVDLSLSNKIRIGGDHFHYSLSVSNGFNRLVISPDAAKAYVITSDMSRRTLINLVTQTDILSRYRSDTALER